MFWPETHLIWKFLGFLPRSSRHAPHVGFITLCQVSGLTASNCFFRVFKNFGLNHTIPVPTPLFGVSASSRLFVTFHHPYMPAFPAFAYQPSKDLFRRHGHNMTGWSRYDKIFSYLTLRREPPPSSTPRPECSAAPSEMSLPRKSSLFRAFSVVMSYQCRPRVDRVEVTLAVRAG